MMLNLRISKTVIERSFFTILITLFLEGDEKKQKYG